jgi:hypothetical protein
MLRQQHHARKCWPGWGWARLAGTIALATGCSIDGRTLGVGVENSEPGLASHGPDAGVSGGGIEPGPSKDAGAVSAQPDSSQQNESPSGTGGLVAPAGPFDLGSAELNMPGKVFDWYVTASGLGTVGGLSLTATNAKDFTLDDGCGKEIQAGQSCRIGVTLNPRSSGAVSTTVTLSNAAGAAVTASFGGRGLVRITVTKQGQGRVTSQPPGIDCGDTCSALFDPATEIALVAEPAAGRLFVRFDGAVCDARASECSLPGDVSRAVSATFSELINNRAFISSETFAPTLGSTAAYDAACNRLAVAAGLSTQADAAFIAAMSTSAAPFVSRLKPGVHGWVGVDGRAFVDRLDLFDFSTVYYPLTWDEAGNWVSVSQFMTGTAPDGSANPNNCADWTDASATSVALATGSLLGPGWWISSGSVRCSEVAPILCLENSKTDTLVRPAVAGKLIWRTNTPYVPGSMTPDNKCQSERPPGVSAARAFVSYPSTPASDVIDPAALYVRPDGSLVGPGDLLRFGSLSSVATSLARMLQTGIWQSADGSYANVDDRMTWTGASHIFDSAQPGESCDGWTSTAGTGIQGNSLLSSAGYWQNTAEQIPCTTPAHLYCVEP